MDEEFMEIALNFANEALAAQEVPVGCIFVKDKQIIASARNTVNETRNPTRHAEINCIDQIVAHCKNKSVLVRELLQDIKVYVTVEPCIMCADILHGLGVSHVVYGCNNDRFGGNTVLNVSNFHKKPYSITSGILADEAMALLKKFYKGTNPMAPCPKLKKKL